MSNRKRRVLWMRFLRWMGKFNNMIVPKEGLSEEQKKGMKIFERAVTIKDADIFLSPLSDTIYIEVNDIYLILDGNDLEIINGKFQYHLHYDEASRNKLKSRVFNVLENRRTEVVNRIKTKSDRTLNSILEDIIDIKSRMTNQ